MYFNSRSYRCTSKSLEYIIRRSHVSIWKWVQKNTNVADQFRIYKQRVKEIFVDETLIQIDGKDYLLAMDSQRTQYKMMFNDAYIKRKNHPSVLPVLQAIKK